MGKLNNVYIMANSGARGNMDQVRQLAGMRGLMSDSQGRTIEIPIRSNFKEGLTLTEYFISAYGARKGLVDTALRTADSGYLTRRLVDIAQDSKITIEDCETKVGQVYTALKDGIKTIIPLSEIVEGRFSLETVKSEDKKKVLVKKNDLITKEQAQLLDDHGIESIKIRSIYKCNAEKGICQKCYGIDLATAKLINIGEAIGIIAAQSIGEPGTQLTMRTFHTGGVDLRKASTITINANSSGKVEFAKDLIPIKIEEAHDSYWISKENSFIYVHSKGGKAEIEIPKNSKLLIKDKENVLKEDPLVEYDPNDYFVFSNGEGTVFYDDSIMTKIKDAQKETFSASQPGQLFVYNKTQVSEVYVSKTIADKHSCMSTVSSVALGNDDDECSTLLILDIKMNPKSTKKANEYILSVSPCNTYPFSVGSILFVKINQKVKKEDSLIYTRLTSNSGKTQDIVQGLPKVEELFEARKPKECAVLAGQSGTINVVNHNTHWVVSIVDDNGTSKDYKLPRASILTVFSGQEIKKGQPLNYGPINPHDLCATVSIDETRKFLSDEVQMVYCSQGVQINKKHIEVIVRQMTMKVTISEMGDSTLLLNEMIDIRALAKLNKSLAEEGLKPAQGTPVLLGITRASLNTDSFISASSFQQTASVLTKAAVEGQKDPMYGLKENVIIGKLIPAGTGMFHYDSILIEG
ncbi:DNA-directed RNA polymerase subunit beta', partial [bacterium]|nr:DNA-directed RNA polymerase subunit beta' [bacterium]